MASSRVRAALFAFVGVVVCWSAFQTASDALTRSYWSRLTDDESLHTEVVEVLAQTGRYSDWKGTRFVPALTMGPALVVPAAGLTAATGVASARVARAVTFAYYLGTLVLIVLLGWECSGHGNRLRRGVMWAGSALALGAYHWGYRGLADTGYYAYGVMGEGAAVFFLLLSAWFVQRSRFFGAGLAASLAILSKPFMIFAPVALAMVLGMRRVSRREWVLVAVGLAAPWILWFGWMVGVMGFSGATEFWARYPAVMRSVNGGGLPAELSLAGIFGGVGRHLNKSRFCLNGGRWLCLQQAWRWARGLCVCVAALRRSFFQRCS